MYSHDQLTEDVTQIISRVCTFYVDIPGHTMNYEFGPVTSNTVYYFVIRARTAKGVSPPSRPVSFTTSDGKLAVRLTFL